jgi:hypothetical protein
VANALVEFAVRHWLETGPDGLIANYFDRLTGE